MTKKQTFLFYSIAFMAALNASYDDKNLTCILGMPCVALTGVN